MTNNDTTVSVVIPCYNAEPFLRETLDSVLGQTFPALEVIVVDDGSTDQSAAIAESYGPPVRVIRQSNQGESVARNRGIDESIGDWIAFIDADDLWLPEKIESQLRRIGERVVAVHTNVFHFGSGRGVRSFSDIPAARRYSPAYVALRSPIHISSLMVRRTSSPRFPTWTRLGEDICYSLDLIRAGEIRLVDEALCGYRKHENSQSDGWPAIATDWHHTIETWIDQRKGRIPQQWGEEIVDAWMKRLVKYAQLARWKRDWPNYRHFCSYLESYSTRPEVAELLRQRVYSPWVYRITDCMERLVGRSAGPRLG
jgi:glycosyltransferase involved in cell wall biosynthesis